MPAVGTVRLPRLGTALVIWLVIGAAVAGGVALGSACAWLQLREGLGAALALFVAGVAVQTVALTLAVLAMVP